MTATAVPKIREVKPEGLYAQVDAISQYFSGKGDDKTLGVLAVLKADLQSGDLEKAIASAGEIRRSLPLGNLDAETLDAKTASIRLLFDIGVYSSQINPVMPYNP